MTTTPSPPDWRGLCEELTEFVARLTNHYYQPAELLVRARAALSQPEPEVVGPTDEEVEVWADQQGFVRGHADHPCGFWIDDGDVGALVRAALARWGGAGLAPVEGEVAELALKELERTMVLLMPVTGKNKIKRFDTIRAALKRLHELENKADLSPAPPAPKPADGEVGELVQPPGRAGLTWQGVIEGLRDVLNDESEDAIQRVWQRSRILDAISVMEANPCPAPVPVAVSERPWEREGWCDSEGRCWIHCPGQSWDTWVLMVPQNAIDGAHCLPATALPLPSVEVEHD